MWPTIIGAVLVAGALVAIILNGVRKRRAGKHVLTCGGNCALCGACGDAPSARKAESGETSELRDG